MKDKFSKVFVFDSILDFIKQKDEIKHRLEISKTFEVSEIYVNYDVCRVNYKAKMNEYDQWIHFFNPFNRKTVEKDMYITFGFNTTGIEIMISNGVYRMFEDITTEIAKNMELYSKNKQLFTTDYLFLDKMINKIDNAIAINETLNKKIKVK